MFRGHRDLTDGIIGVYHQAHYELGDGFLEKVCQRALVIALIEAGVEVAEDVPFRVYFRGFRIRDSGLGIPDQRFRISD